MGINSFRKARGGFTLIELLVVIAIIGLLSSIVLASLGQARVKARDSKRVQDLIQLRTALEQYALDNNGLYPADPNPLGDTWGSSSWECSPINIDDCSGGAGPDRLDEDRLVALSPYLNPRPTDPSAGSTGRFPQGSYKGYYYKVSNSRKYYKLAIFDTVENMNSIPDSFKDPYFYEVTPPITISIYSPEAYKWRAYDECSPPIGPPEPTMC
ncbi:MAG: type II secretion system protein [Candidatus Vogelbacteria bacterium]